MEVARKWAHFFSKSKFLGTKVLLLDTIHPLVEHLTAGKIYHGYKSGGVL